MCQFVNVNILWWDWIVSLRVSNTSMSDPLCEMNRSSWTRSISLWDKQSEQLLARSFYLNFFILVDRESSLSPQHQPFQALTWFFLHDTSVKKPFIRQHHGRPGWVPSHKHFGYPPISLVPMEPSKINQAFLLSRAAHQDPPLLPFRQ